MYESHFRLRQRPFLAAPSLERYFPGQSIEHARQTLVRCLERTQGPGLLIGPAGTGKSLVCQLLADQLAASFRVALLSNPRLTTRRALLQSILFELGLPYRDLDEGEMRLALRQHLEPSTDSPQGLLLIVDEAQSLPLRLLEELRSLTNVVRQGQSRVQLVLAGGPALEERFAHPKLASFQQRIAARCYLQSLNRHETGCYVQSQLAAAGAPTDQLFAPEALAAVFQATDGIPRLINQVCDLALHLAAVAHRSQVDAGLVEEAWVELQQLPAPWQNPPATSSREPANVVEFGALAEDPAWSPAESFSPATMLSDMTDSLPTPPTPVAPVPAASVPAASVPTATLSTATASAAVPTVSAKSSVKCPAESSVPAAPLAQLFGDDFEQEEVVLDRLSPQASWTIESRHRVSCQEGRELAQLLPSVPPREVPEPPTVSIAVAAASPTIVAPRAAEEQLWEAIRALPPVDDPRRWTPGRLATIETVAVGGEWTSEPALPRDDRDLLVVEDDEPSTPPVADPDRGRAERREYRQLFSRLRRG